MITVEKTSLLRGCGAVVISVAVLIFLIIVGAMTYVAWQNHKEEQARAEAEQGMRALVDAFRDDLIAVPPGEAGRKQANDIADRLGITLFAYRSTAEITEAAVYTTTSYEGSSFHPLAGGSGPHWINLCSVVVVPSDGAPSLRKCGDTYDLNKVWCTDPVWQQSGSLCWDEDRQRDAAFEAAEADARDIAEAINGYARSYGFPKTADRMDSTIDDIYSHELRHIVYSSKELSSGVEIVIELTRKYPAPSMVDREVSRCFTIRFSGDVEPDITAHGRNESCPDIARQDQ